MSVMRESSPYLGIGMTLAVTLLVGVLAGRWMDERFGTEPIFFLMGAAFGLFAVFYNLYKVYKLFTKPRPKP